MLLRDSVLWLTRKTGEGRGCSVGESRWKLEFGVRDFDDFRLKENNLVSI